MRLIERVEQELLPELRIRSVKPYDPIEVIHVPSPWKLLGSGNYAAVLMHPEERDKVVKVYAEGRPGLSEEIEVYRKLGRHPAYSECYHAGRNYLVLKRLTGLTLYECLRRGIRIPEQVILDIDEALAYARALGLNPHDVHAKNVMMKDGRGKVVDVSDFLKTEPCLMWDDLKKSYYTFYKPLMYRYPVPIPSPVLNLLRKGYRYFRRWNGS